MFAKLFIDKIIIVFPNGKSMLIDAAESDMSGKIITYIHQQGYDGLTYVVATACYVEKNHSINLEMKKSN